MIAMISEEKGEKLMPIHDWARKPAGLFHHFHQQWAGALCNALNAGRLPEGFYALLEQHSAGVEPDILALEREPRAGTGHQPTAGIAVADAPPRTRFVTQASEEDIYAAKADRIAIYHPLGDVVAIIELVSPGNKSSRHALRSFVEKTLEFLSQGVNILIVDLFPPSKRDPQGIHRVIWDEIREEPFELPPDKQRTLVAYSASVPKRAYVEPVGVGDVLCDMPVFLDSGTYILAPLEPTYIATWQSCPEPLRELIASPEN
jgi:Protein of unknown function (DUF4058)